MGSDKARVALAGQPLLHHVLVRLVPQCDDLAVNGPATLADLVPAGVPIVDDAPRAGLGPLGGLQTGLGWASANVVGARWLVTVPVDTPFLPVDLVTQLHAARGGSAAVCLADRVRLHGVVGLWSLDLLAELERAVRHDGLRQIGLWAKRVGAARLELPDAAVWACFNVNTPEDLARAEEHVRRG